MTSARRLLLHALVFGLLGLAATQARAASSMTYDPTADFGIENGNPNGVWSYGWMPSDFSSFNPYAATAPGPPFAQWYKVGSGDNTPNVSLNTSAGSLHGVGPGQLTIHPGPGNVPSVLRFTAPVGGTYGVVGEFLPGDGASMAVGVRRGGSWLWQGSDAGSFELAPVLSAGDTLDFAVYGGHAYGNTPLVLTVTAPVPEPATALLLGTCLLGMAGLRPKKRRG